MPGRIRTHYSGSYQLRARQLRAAAYANPATRCMASCTCSATTIDHCTCGRACGKTLAQHPPTKTGKPPSWDAGHARSGDPSSPLRTEVAGCNRRNGASEGNRRRLKLIPTRQW